MKKIFLKVANMVPDRIILSYWPGIMVTLMNCACLAMTVVSQGSDILAFVNIVCITGGLRIIYHNYEHQKNMRHYYAAFHIAMAEVEPAILAIFQREHSRHGLKQGERLTKGQLLAVDDEITALLDRARERYKTLVDESKTDKP